MLPSDLIFADKPAGWLTHSDGRTSGLVDRLSEILGVKLYVVHRLDRETTGALVFARSPETAARLTELFSARKIEKEYLLITDRSADFSKREVTTYIRQGQNFSSGKESEKATTRFEKLKDYKKFSLWKAHPLTGKTHQIRLHAHFLDMPILGDALYGGTEFPGLMLHCRELSGDGFRWETAPPRLMEKMEYLERPSLAAWLCQYDRRQRLFSEVLKDSRQTLRLVHDKEGSGYNCDLYGPVLWFYRFSDSPLREEEKQDIETLHQEVEAEKFVVRQMFNRGKDPHKDETEGCSWQADENNRRFQLHSGRGWSPGLFLDQRANRDWVQENSADKDVLNLFCYTAGFSVAAALGGAKSVTSVDTSKQTLEWARENFALNQIDLEAHQFWAQDAREFLQMAERQGRKYDLIICDPPSFARNKKGVFRIEKDFQALIRQMGQLLLSEGVILFSTNYERWGERQLLRQLPPDFTHSPSPPPVGDHEGPGQEPLMKSILIRRKVN